MAVYDKVKDTGPFQSPQCEFSLELCIRTGMKLHVLLEAKYIRVSGFRALHSRL